MQQRELSPGLERLFYSLGVVVTLCVWAVFYHFIYGESWGRSFLSGVILGLIGWGLSGLFRSLRRRRH
jgi:hypothetical protein